MQRCSGTGCFELVTAAVVSAIATKYHKHIQLEVAFAVEVEPFKQQWLMTNVIGPHTCLFEDITRFVPNAVAGQPAAGCTARRCT